MPCALYTRVAWARRDRAALALVCAAAVAAAALSVGAYVSSVNAMWGAPDAGWPARVLAFTSVDDSNVTCARFVYHTPRGPRACVDACPAAGDGVCLSGAGEAKAQARTALGGGRSLAQVRFLVFLILWLPRRLCAHTIATAPCSCWGTAAPLRRWRRQPKTRAKRSVDCAPLPP